MTNGCLVGRHGDLPPYARFCWQPIHEPKAP